MVGVAIRHTVSGFPAGWPVPAGAAFQAETGRESRPPGRIGRLIFHAPDHERADEVAFRGGVLPYTMSVS